MGCQNWFTLPAYIILCVLKLNANVRKNVTVGILIFNSTIYKCLLK